MQNIQLIGIGQTMRGDDAVGLAAIEAWQQAHPNLPQGVQVLSFESPGLALLDTLTNCSAALLVDAVRSGGRPGQIYRLHESDLASFSPAAASAHGLGVAETLALGRSLYPNQLPDYLVFIGVEAGTVQVGQPISQACKSALPRVINLIDQTLIEIGTIPSKSLEELI